MQRIYDMYRPVLQRNVGNVVLFFFVQEPMFSIFESKLVCFFIDQVYAVVYLDEAVFLQVFGQLIGVEGIHYVNEHRMSRLRDLE